MDYRDIKLGGYFFCPNCQSYHSSSITCEEVQTAKKHHKEIFDNLFRETTEEEKAMQTQPLFTLTAEEVEMVERNLVYFFKSDKEAIDNLLNRIKQWQDENNSK